MSTPSIAIVGGGFSGTLAAVHLSRRLPNIPIVLFEESAEAGPGLAYGTRSSDHLLNIRAGAMSAFGDAPDDFRRFASRELGRDVSPDEFLPRSWYGDYLRHLLLLAQISSPALEVRQARVHDIVSGEDGYARLLLKNGEVFEVSKVVLATGNQDSAFSGSVWASHTRSTRDPAAFENLANDASVVIIGSGLSMTDAVADLQRLGHTGPIHVTSRHGLLPHIDVAPSGVEPPVLEHLPDSDLRRSVRLFRKAVETHEAAGGNWRDLFAALRPVTPGLWQELSARDRKRFLRFLSPFWEIHRHQCAPQTRAITDRLIASGRLTLHRGTLVSVERKGERWSVELAARAKGQTTRTLVADRIFDATGPARDLQTIRQPLVCNLLRRGFLVPDAHRLGAETLPDYRALQRNGLPSPWLHVIGPMLRARYFEATAVGELRLHAAALAARIAREFAEWRFEETEATAAVA
jgi:uncharacterized NAD(P)/FAD-binding protein YdhS